jgi:hypothetical protein
MKSRTSAKIARKTKGLDEIFPKEWKEKGKELLTKWKGSEESFDRNLAGLFELIVAYKCLADIALAYAPKELYGSIVVDAEKVCNEIGTSLIRDGEEVSECLTKKHKDCKGSYVSSNPNVQRKIICKCKCPQPTATEPNYNNSNASN